jgi:hypothetical protein
LEQDRVRGMKLEHEGEEDGVGWSRVDGGWIRMENNGAVEQCGAGRIRRE